MVYCVYFHINKINGKKYCGITNNVDRRWRGNGIEYKPSATEGESPFWNAICKYGWDGFEHVISESGLTFEQACEKEKLLIKTLKLQNKKHGYNVASGGNGGLIYKEHPRGMAGKPQTEYQIDVMKELRKTFNPMSDIKWDVDKPHPRGMKGKKQTERQKLIASQSQKGKFVSDETRKRMSEAQKGKIVSDETRRKQSQVRKGTRLGSENSSAKKVIVRQNGNEKIYDTTKDAMKDLGISTIIFYKLVKSGEAYQAKGNVKHKNAHLNGITINYL